MLQIKNITRDTTMKNYNKRIDHLNKKDEIFEENDIND
jgi:hypothetical protein